MRVQSAAEFRQTYYEATQSHCAEPILAIGFVSTAGYVKGLMADALAGKAIASISPLANRMFRRTQRQTRATEVSNQLMCITASSAYLFDFVADGQPFTVRSAPTVWSRAAIRVTAEPRGRLSQHLHVDFATGERLDLDVNFGKGEWQTFNDSMLALLLHPSVA